LIGRFASLNTKIVDPLITNIFEFHTALKDVALEVLATDRIYVHGHTTLKTYLDWGTLRYQDEVFTTLRNPIEQVISQINYVLTRIFSDEILIQHDTSGWRREFSIKDVDASTAPEPAVVMKLARSILRNGGVVPSNVVCHYLGNGTAASAIEQVALHNIEVTILTQYHSWLQSRFNIKYFTQMNPSKKFVRFSDFDSADQSFMTSIVSEDQIFYQHVERRLQDMGANSLVGLQIIDEKGIKSASTDSSSD